MKSFNKILTSIIIFQSILTFGQGARAPSKEIRESFCKAYDLSGFLSTNKETGTDGVFDTSYSRIQIHFDTVYRDKKNPFMYHVTGASRHMKTVTPFKGDIVVTSVQQFDGGFYWVVDTINNKQFKNPKKYTIINATYKLYEDSSAKYSGAFKGKLEFGLHQEGSELIDDLGDYMGDGYRNYTYEGTWTGYKSGKAVICSWADGHMPAPNEDGEYVYSISRKYWKNGWERNKKMELIDNPKYWWLKEKK